MGPLPLPVPAFVQSTKVILEEISFFPVRFIAFSPIRCVLLSFLRKIFHFLVIIIIIISLSIQLINFVFQQN